MEVSDASTIVQEAADEDANIIFGAVVDPALKGKVKITVIATGFGSPAVSRERPAAAQTPVDLAPYADQARLRGAGDGGVPARLATPRRLILDVPLKAAAGGPGAADGDAGGPAGRLTGAEEDDTAAFDVPAFLRRHEG
jgi:cell division protein FtsZ